MLLSAHSANWKPAHTGQILATDQANNSCLGARLCKTNVTATSIQGKSEVARPRA